MPIYMDRHEIEGEGLTNKEIAEAHEKDLEIQDKYGCNVMTYWYDEEKTLSFA